MSSTKAKKEVFCIHHILTAYDKETGFTLDDIDVNLCTYLVYAYFGITESGHLVSKRPMLDHYKENVIKFNNLKNDNGELKTLLAIGGWENENSPKYSNVAADPGKKRNFIRSTTEFIKKYNFDGIALHWCFPGMFGGDPIYDKINFSRWLKQIKNEFARLDFKLMVMVQGEVNNIDLSYDVPGINESVDFIFLTTYDLYGKWRDHIGIHSGLYKSPNANVDYLNADFVVRNWIENGAAPEKLIMGIPFFGRTFTLADANENQPGAKFSYVGEHGEFMDYLNICKNTKNGNWILKWDSDAMGPYSYNGNQWVGYDNIQSIQIKGKYIDKYKLGGAAGIFIEDDDFRGICDNEKYPLLSTLAKAMGLNVKKEISKLLININLQKKNKKNQEQEVVLNHNEKFEL
ncbi:acidic mammalian chitinase-like [Condylostylus longicornis]|uniref:acidic mammalian chitinase-like n=1 Tax=Condylostylus longicornis TaxID=2530218 RepID=UPI00244E3B55|nr:acidic mammalian chitinase-like [Condylostylus longicornis]